MGVYIPNMKMPAACVKCRFCTAFECFASGEYIKDHYKRNDDCPLVAVKEPHGDLIDRDALIKKARVIHSYDCDGFEFEYMGVLDGTLVDAPTVLEAEG